MGCTMAINAAIGDELRTGEARAGTTRWITSDPGCSVWWMCVCVCVWGGFKHHGRRRWSRSAMRSRRTSPSPRWAARPRRFGRPDRALRSEEQERGLGAPAAASEPHWDAAGGWVPWVPCGMWVMWVMWVQSAAAPTGVGCHLGRSPSSSGAGSVPADDPLADLRATMQHGRGIRGAGSATRGDPRGQPGAQPRESPSVM